MFRTLCLAAPAALALVILPAPLHADDPHDPTMRTAAARAKDKARIQELNRQELARVRARDAGYARDWAAYRAYYGDRRRAQPPACRKDRAGRCRR